MDAPICRQTTAIVVRVAPSVQVGQAAMPVVVSVRLDKQHAAALVLTPKPIANTVAHAERLVNQGKYAQTEYVWIPVQEPKSDAQESVLTPKQTTIIVVHVVPNVWEAHFAMQVRVPVRLDKPTAMAFA
jgi:hypothetical protein